MDNTSLYRTLSETPSILYVEIAPTLAQVWFDRDAIELAESDKLDLRQQIGWSTSDRITLRDDAITNGVIELLITPNYTENYPEKFQQVLDYITLVLRAAAPSCPDYQINRSDMALELKADGSTTLN